MRRLALWTPRRRGSFTYRWIALSAALLAGGSGSVWPVAGEESRPREDLSILLVGHRFSTSLLVTEDGLDADRLPVPDLGGFAPELVREPFAGSDSDLFIVQAAGPKEQTMLRARLDELGVAVRGSIPRYAYLARLGRQDLRALVESPAVFWLGLYQPAWRIAPELDGIAASEGATPLVLTALFEPGSFSSAPAVAAALSRPGLEILAAARRSRGWKVRIAATAADARDLAARPDCLWVERFAGYELHNNVARASSDVATGRGAAPGPMMDVEDVWARGLRGEGQIAAISDTGLSTGELATLHHDFGQQGSATNPLRVIRGYALGRSTWDDNQTLGGGHGTHVAGSLVGNGVRSGADPATDDYPAASYAGTAPKAQLVFQSILAGDGTLGGLPANLGDLFQPAYDDGARVHSNSWGSPVFGAYTSDSQEVDEFAWAHRDMVITYTAGNQGRDTSPTDGVIDPDSIGAPGTAKNAITVGATENYRPDFAYEVPAGDCTSNDGIEQRTWGWFNPSSFSAAPVFPDLMADHAAGLGAFSSRGPTDDGRLKPDLVAPGIAVVSTRTDKFQSYEQWGICEVPPALRPYYVTNGGTSMANPLTAGAAVLTRQYYRDGWHAEGSRLTREIPELADGFEASAALVKATLLNGAWDVTPGQYGVGPTQELPPAWDTGLDLPNNAEGYGRVDLEGSLFPGAGYGHDPAREMEIHDVSPGLSTGGFDDYVIPVTTSGDPLTVTLVWTDPYASLAAGPKLVNDLDLTVTSPGGTPYFPGGVDRVAGSADRLNNVEQTRVSAPPAGDWTVRVSGWNVPGNGEPGSTTQPYALVISGVLTPPCATPSSPSGLSAQATGSNVVELTWSAVAADSYSVYRATDLGGPYSRVASGILAPSFTDVTVSGGTTYYYVVTAANDPGCESDASAEASAEAFGDCTLSPAFNGLTSVAPIDAGGACGLRLAWNGGVTACPGGPAVYNVYRSTTPGFSPGPGNLLASCVAGVSFDDTGTASGVEYHYVVRAEDAGLAGGGPCRGGNEDGNTLELAGTAGGDAQVLLFADDFDGSQTPGDLWTLGLTLANPYVSGSCATPPAGSGPITYANDWYRPETGFCSGSALASNDGAADPAYSDTSSGYAVLGVPPSGGPPAEDGGLVLPAGATSITLTFDHDYDFESTTSDWDGGRLLISDASNWLDFTPLTPAGGYPGTVFNTTFFCHPWPGQAAYVADSIGCVPATFDLTPWAGERIWLAWNHGGDRFASADDGWIVDNVRIEAAVPSTCNAAPPRVEMLTATARDGEVVLEWLNPDGPAYDSTLIRYRTDTFPQDPGDGTFLADPAGAAGKQDSVVHGGLANGTTYYYTAFVDNGSGTFSAARHVSARPFDTSGAVRWAYSTGASALAPPGIGSVYGVANDRVLHSMETGTTGGTWPTDWTPLAMNAPAQSRPPIVPLALGGAAKVAFLGSQDRSVHAVDAATGEEIWTSPDLGGLVQGSPAGLFTAFGAAHDLILTGTRNAAGDSAFHGLSLADGTLVWTFDNGGGPGGLGIISSGASLDVANRRAYFASRSRPGGSSHTVWCLDFDAASATLRWSRDVGDVDGSPILHAGRIYVGTNSGEVHALDALDGTSLWAAPFATGDGPIKGYVIPRFGTSQLVFSSTGTVWAIVDDGSSASLAWSHGAIPDPSIPLVAISSPHVWVGGSDGALHQLDLTGGSPVAAAVTLGDGSAAVGSPGLDVAEGIAYVGTDAGRLYAVKTPVPARAGTSTGSGRPPSAAGSAAEVPRKSPGTHCEPVRLGSPQVLFADGFESGDTSAWGAAPASLARLAATDVLDATFHVSFPEPLAGDHVLRLRLTTPHGHHYQTLTLPVASDSAESGRTRRLPGFPRPLLVLPPTAASSGSGAQTFSVAWPIAGTPIVHSSLYGDWTVEAYVDGDAAPCAAATHFRLTQ